MLLLNLLTVSGENTNDSIRQLDFANFGCVVDDEQCAILSRLALSVQCRGALIKIKNLLNVLDLVNTMFNIQV